MRKKDTTAATKKRKSTAISSNSEGGRSEQAAQKSAAEFFSEHQQIAGFDNPGKSLFTTIRELVENSLDAAEAIHVLPEVKVTVKEYSEENHNTRHGIRKKTYSSLSQVDTEETEEILSQQLPLTHSSDIGSDQLSQSVGGKKARLSAGGDAKELMYYEITVEDNGCGIKEKDISHLLGKVLSGSKHGVRQTRGKFGLGSKMALIWSKKSSGLPIKIRTAHCTSSSGTPSAITEMILDIDIQHNEPNVISSSREDNPGGWRGVQFGITIGGNWPGYRSRVLQYFQQLAVITPYAFFSLEFQAAKDPKKNFTAEFVHRSDQMPPIAGVVLPHPKSVNNITLSSLLSQSVSPTLNHFLGHDLSSLSPKLIRDIVDSLNLNDAKLSSLTSSHIAALCQVLRDVTAIKPPLASCLSPAGEYNMRLGVLKELKPRLVATYTDKPGAHEGHAFLVEAALSLGGESVKEGINIFRFANRIPMLFETGADVVTQVATKRIKWSTYLIDPKKDSVGVYVSIVSTRIPFKGTSKEYIGDDVLEIQHSVKRALIGCCQQMKGQLAESMAKKNVFEKQKALLKYIPDVSRSLMGVMQHIKQEGRVLAQHRALFEQVDSLSEAQLLAAGSKKNTRKNEGYSDKLLVSTLTEAVTRATAEEDVIGEVQPAAPAGLKEGRGRGKKGSEAAGMVDLLLAANSGCAIPVTSCDSLLSTELQQTELAGRWLNIAGELAGRVWVPFSREDYKAAYVIRS